MSGDIFQVFGQPVAIIITYAGFWWGAMVVARKLDNRIDEIVWDGIEDWIDLFEEGKISAPMLGRKLRRSRDSFRNRPSGEALESLASRVIGAIT